MSKSKAKKRLAAPATPTAEIKEASRVTKEEWREFTKTVWSIANVSHKDHPATFPLEIPTRLIKLFSFVGDTVLDPFAGTGTTGVAARELDRRSVMVDQSAHYCKLMETKYTADAPDGNKPHPRVVCGDSRALDFLGDDSVGLIVTSPPYWNKADYGTASDNIGAIPRYQDFLDELALVFQECYRVLQPGRKLCVVTANVSQHTEHGLVTVPLAPDMLAMLRNMGFVVVNDIIWSKDRTGGRWGSANGQRPIFGSYPYPPNFLFKTVHEHIIIVAKPPATKRNGPNAIPYANTLPDWNLELPTAPQDA